MKKTLILVTLLVLVAAAALALFVLPPWLAQRAWDRAADRITERLGRAVRADDVSFSLFSPLVVRGVTVAGPAGASDVEGADATPLLTIESIEVDLDAWSLLGDSPDVASVSVDRPVITVPLAANGLPGDRELIERLRALAARGEGEGGDGGSGGGGGLLGRVLRATPQFEVTRGEVRLVGPGAATWCALSPQLTLPPEGLIVEHVEIVIKNASMLAEEPVYELTASADVPALDHKLLAEATLGWNDRSLTASLEGGRPFTWSLGERTLSVIGLSYGSDTGLRVRGVALTQPASDADADADARPFVRIKEVVIGLDEPGKEAKPGKEAEPSPSNGDDSTLAALAARIDSVEFIEPEIYFSRDPEAELPIADLEEQLYVDELDARLDEDLGGGGQAPPEKPEPAPKPGKRRRLKPNGEKLRVWVAHQFEGLEASFASFTDVVHRAGRRLPVREVHVRRGRFLYEEAASGKGSVSRKLYNFFLDAERLATEPVFVFKMHFETPDAARSRNRVEGRIHLLTRDLEVGFKIEQLQLERYRPLLPTSLRVSPDSVVHDTDLTLAYSSERDELRAHGRVFMRAFEIFHPGIAAAPLEDMDAGAEFALTVDFAKHRVELAPTKIYLNDLTFSFHGTLEDYAVAPRVHFEFTLPRTDAMRIVRSVPLGLVPRLDGVQMVGSLALDARVDLDMADLNTLKYVLKPQPLGLGVTHMGRHVDLDKLQGRFRHTVRERDGGVTTFRVGPGSRYWTPLGKVSRYITKALTTTEDGRFFAHDGFSPSQIRRSIIANLERGYFYRGASTISQQLVKNLYLTRDKTISRKLQEVFIVWQLEQHVPKEHILALYLNIIEWGPNLYGITKAAKHYFAKKPSELTLLDTAFLVSIIPNPRRFYHQYERGEVTPRWRARIRRIIEAMAARGKIGEAEARRAAPYSPYFDGRRPARRDDTPKPAPAPKPEERPGGAREGDIPMPGGH